MTEAYKVLGRAATSDTSETLIYTVPSSKSVIVNNITVVNRGGTTANFSIRVTESSSPGPASYIYNSSQISATSSEVLEPGITLAAGGKIYVTGTTNTTFSAYGIELSETGKYKILGQESPSANTWTTLYTAGTGKSALIRSINASGSNTDTFDVAIVDSASDVPGNSNYILYSEPINSGETISVKAGYTLATGNTIKVRSTGGAVVFSAFGADI